MIYEDAANHTYTIEEIVIDGGDKKVMKDFVIKVLPRTEYLLTIFNDDEQIVYRTQCTGIAQAKEYVSNFLGYNSEEDW